jgi:hypothetical protein
MGLIPGFRPNLLAQFRIANHKQSVVLHVKGRRGELGQTNEFGEVFLGHYMIRVVVLYGPAGFDGFGYFHQEKAVGLN